MDTLHTVLRSIRGETKARRDHLDVFREFLDHLDRAARRKTPARTTKAGEGQGQRAASAKRRRLLIRLPARRGEGGEQRELRAG